MVEDGSLGLSTYIVERAFDKSMLSLALNFKDDSGKTVLLTNAKLLVTRETLETPDGRVLGTVTHKVLSLLPTYELHEGGVDGPVTGIIKQQLTLGSLIGKSTIKILGSDGQPLATASGDIMNFNFIINHNDGTTVANVTRTFGSGGIKDALVSAIKDQYALKILQQGKVPTLTLLEFLVVLEVMINRSRGSGGGSGVHFGGR
jgi:uncharacterized protein YxjI